MPKTLFKGINFINIQLVVTQISKKLTEGQTIIIQKLSLYLIKTTHILTNICGIKSIGNLYIRYIGASGTNESISHFWYTGTLSTSTI